MERIGHLARTFEEAEAWDRAQDAALTPDERRAVLAQLKKRLMGPDCNDLRACREGRIRRLGADGRLLPGAPDDR